MVHIIVGSSDLLQGDTLQGINSENNLIYANEGADSVQAGPLGDKIYGWTGNDTLIGSAANDAIGGDQDDDSLVGGGGDDQLYGGSGNDTIMGNTGKDFITGDDGNDSVFAGQDNDVVYGGFGNDTVNGDEGNDLLSGEAGDDSLIGGNGDDQLFGGADNNTLTGGAGRDVFIISPGDATIDANDKIDTINDFEVGTVSTGGPTVDLIDLRELGVSNFADLQSHMSISNGTDTKIDFSVNYDRILIIKGILPNQLFPEHFRFPGNNQAPTAAGDNYSVAKDALLIASSVLANDTDPNHDVLQAGVSTGPSHSALFQFNPDGSFTYQPVTGFEGTDSFTYIANDGSLFSNTATVSIKVGNAHDGIVTGTAGNDLIDNAYVDVDGDKVTAGADSIVGLSGNDTINGGAGNDSMTGGTGSDRFVFGVNPATTDVVNDFEVNAPNEQVDLTAFGYTHFQTQILPLLSQVGADVHINLPNSQVVILKNVQLSTLGGNDFVGVSDADGIVTGTTGNDVIDNNYVDVDGDKVTAGADSIVGLSGNDTINGGAGNDSMSGGTGSDRFVFGIQPGATDVVKDFEVNAVNEQVDLTAFGYTQFHTQILPLLSQVGADVHINLPNAQVVILENVQLSTLGGNDFVGVSDADGIVTGTAGNDVIDNNYVDVDGDKVTSGADSIVGLSGNDTINGGAGNDSMAGGTGGDHFVFGVQPGATDVVKDFEVNTVNEQVDLTAFGYTQFQTQILPLLSQVGADVHINLPNGQMVILENVQLSTLHGNDFVGVSDADGIVTGTTGNDVIDNNYVDVDGDKVTSGADSIVGLSGNDTINGGAGNDTMTGGTGSDRFVFGVNAGATDVVKDFEVNAASEQVDLTAFGYTQFHTQILPLLSQVGADVHINLPNAQVVILENVQLSTLGGNDFVGVSDADGIVTGTPGNDSITATSYVDVDGDKVGAGNDTVVALGGNDYAAGDLGNDSISGGQGEDTLTGGAGNDTLVGGLDNDRFLVESNQGFGTHDQIGTTTDLFQNISGHDKIDLTAFLDVHSFNDLSITTVSPNVFAISLPGGQSLTVYAEGSLTPTDVIVNPPLNDGIVTGTQGNDSITATSYVDVDGDKVGTGNDTVVALGGNDYAGGDLGNDSISGGAGNDTLNGGQGNDTLVGGAGDDRFVADNNQTFGTLDQIGTPADLFQNITAHDKIDLTAFTNVHSLADINIITIATNVFGITLPAGQLIKVYAEGALTSNDFTFSHDGIVTGTAGNDLINTNYVDTDGDKVGAGNDSVVALAGNDTIYGGEGNDSIDAGDGKDILVGGAGADVLNGGAGDDMVDYVTSTAGVVINLATGHGSVGDAEGDTYTGIEGAFGGYGNDTIIANDSGDYLHGGLGGSDSIVGGAGNDFLAGRAGDDTITGGAGNDKIYGDSDDDSGRFTSGTDADVLSGGSGNDLVDGGWGNDILNGDAGDDTMFGGEGSDLFIVSVQPGATDTILDFSVNTPNEKIDLTAFGFTQFAQIKSLMTQVGNDVHIALPNNELLILKSVHLSDLTGDDFVNVQNHDGIVTGTTGNDVIDSTYTDVDGDKVTAGNDTINALSGNDTINGGAGNDTINGGAGGDRFVFGVNAGATDVVKDFDVNTVNEQVDLTAFGYTQFQTQILPLLSQVGNDVHINLPNSQVVVLENVQLNTLTNNDFVGVSGHDGIVTGTNGNDVIDSNYVDVDGDKVTAGNDSINALSGNDTIIGGAGNDTINGGAGGDHFVFGVNAGATDVVKDFDVHTTNEQVDLTAFGYTQFQTQILPLLSQVGNDVHINLPNSQVVVLENVQLNTLTSDDFVGVSGHDGIVTGTAGNDVIDNNYVDIDGDKVTSGADSIVGLSGNDTINGGAGNDTITGGTGGDHFVFGVNAGATDVVKDFDVNTVNEQVDLTAFGYTQFQTQILPLLSQVGNDVHINLPNSQVVVLENVQLNTLTNDDFVGVSGHDGIVTGTNGNDLINASYRDSDGDKVGTGNDTVVALAGNDSLFGYEGNDSIDAGTGNDTLNGGAGTDTLNGGEGYDLVDYVPSTTGVVINLATGHGSNGDAEGDVYVSIEGAFGGYGNDTMIASNADTYLHGGLGGNDSIVGGNGNDFLAGRAGNDTVLGGAGDDKVYGDSDTASGRFTSGTDSDLLVGGAGNDLVDGGWGDDFLYGDEYAPTPVQSVSVGPNLIVNGSFEQYSGGRSADIGYRADNVTGWEKLAGGGWGNWELLKSGYSGISVPDGRYALDMESSGNSQNMDIQQHVQGVVNGQTYTVSLVASAEAAWHGNGLNVYWGGQVVGHIATEVVGNQTFSYTVTGGAGDGSNALRLQGQGPIDGVGLAIDNVKVMAVTTPQPIAGGNDTLYGGNGGDIMTGGGGHDVFQFNATDTFNSLITDFTHGTDKIELIGVTYSQLTIANENGTAAIYFNVNNHAEAIHLEHVNATTLGSGDFIFS